MGTSQIQARKGTRYKEGSSQHSFGATNRFSVAARRSASPEEDMNGETHSRRHATKMSVKARHASTLHIDSSSSEEYIENHVSRTRNCLRQRKQRNRVLYTPRQARTICEHDTPSTCYFCERTHGDIQDHVRSASPGGFFFLCFFNVSLLLLLLEGGSPSEAVTAL